jgi:2'-5' RNA ligase
MRLFVAIDVGPAIAAAAQELIGELRRRTAERAPRARIAWVAADRHHVTVRFIGQADDTSPWLA